MAQVLRRMLLPVALGCFALGAEPPAWFKALRTMPGLESSFVQEGESAVFKAVRKTGRILVAKGGFLKVSYEGGLLLVADGKALVQYDPRARSAQRLDLAATLKEAPLLNLLLNPEGLEASYLVEVQEDSVVLVPKDKKFPKLELKGKGGLVWKVMWVDRSKAKQTLTLTQPKVCPSFPKGTFSLEVPNGTRWIK